MLCTTQRFEVWVLIEIVNGPVVVTESLVLLWGSLRSQPPLKRPGEVWLAVWLAVV